jgi:hypothetical protein
MTKRKLLQKLEDARLILAVQGLLTEAENDRVKARLDRKAAQLGFAPRSRQPLFINSRS